MADAVFFHRVHFREGDVVAVGDKNRIVAESLIAAHGPDQGSVDPAFEGFHMPIWPAQRQGADEMGGAVVLARQFVLDGLHGDVEILVRTGPARRINARLATERGDREAAVIGECRQAGPHRRRPRFQFCVGGKSGAGFLRFVQPRITGGDDIAPERLQQGGDFPDLAGVVAGDDQFRFLKMAGHKGWTLNRLPRLFSDRKPVHRCPWRRGPSFR